MKTRGVPSGYVEDLNDARTPLADFFSILLETIMKGLWPVKVGRVNPSNIRAGCSLAGSRGILA